MTKRRWLKAAIEEAQKPQTALPWTRDTAAVEPAILSAIRAKSANPAHA